MNIFTNLRRFKKLNLKKITGKEIALFAINRKIRQHCNGENVLGDITDLSLDRAKKAITFTLEKTTAENTITIHGYRIIANQNQAYLLWEKMTFLGPAAQQYRRVFDKIDRITIPKFAVSMAKGLMEQS